MKASYRWLRELVPQLTASPEELAARLTGAGLEIEGMTAYGAATSSCLVARVESIRPHPTKSGLRLVTVDRGGAKQEVVCGAPNVPDPGGLVVLAPLGAHLPAVNMTIAKRAIAGVESEGMLCSEEELGLGEGHEGIIVLPQGLAEPGTLFSTAAPNAHDTVFEIGLTPNRPDGLGHVGLAREICALYGFPFVLPKTGIEAVKSADVETAKLASIAVEDAERCPHYGAAGAVDVTIRPSPLALRYRLQALGVRSISNIVDVTNIVMLEYGHPMHAFDLDRVRGAKIVVRRAQEGEKLTTLDGVERALVSDDLLICDGAGGVALAGVMGGATSEIHADTRRVLFECAWFDPRGVRRSSRRHGMHTESSHRFERGVDPGDVAHVLDRAVALTLELGGGAASRGRVHVQGARISSEPLPVARRALRFRAHRVSDLLGVELPFSESVALLERLGCEITKKTDSECEVLAPTHRPDIGREVDLVEEVIRVHGIDRVPAELPAIRASRDVGGREELGRRARDVATGLGLSEAITYGFTSARTIELLKAPRPAVLLKNPLGEHHAVMRTTLVPGLLDAVKNARRHGERNVREFTIGPAFLPSRGGGDGLPHEELRLAAVLAGDRPGWLEKPKPLDAWDAKGYALELASRLSGEQAHAIPAPGAEAPKHLHPRGAGVVEVLGQRIGSFGPLHPDVVDALELDGEVLVIELSLESFVKGRVVPQYAAIPRFPAATRDIALVVKDSIAAGEVQAAVRDAAGPLAKGVQLFDRFVGGQVPEGSSSLAFHVVYRAEDRTLTDAEVDAAHANVVKEVGSRFGATLRQ
jgi:phenylalanyl-tRNA synthetase beta chain